MIQEHIPADRSPAVDPRRSEPRIDACADVSLRKLGSSPVAARLINISSNGFMAETETGIEAGARVWLNLPGLNRVNALVLWSQGLRLGGQFSAPIDPLVVLNAIGQAAGTARA